MPYYGSRNYQSTYNNGGSRVSFKGGNPPYVGGSGGESHRRTSTTQSKPNGRTRDQSKYGSIKPPASQPENRYTESSPRQQGEYPEENPNTTESDETTYLPPKGSDKNTKSAKYQGSDGDNVQSRQGNEADQRKGLELLNVIRKEVNLPPLKFSATLELAALRHSQYQLSIKDMTHDDPTGGLGARARKAGFQGGTLAENVAFGQRDEESVMQSWKKSPGHYKNMINPAYTHVGLAKVSSYWTQFFGRGNGNE